MNFDDWVRTKLRENVFELTEDREIGFLIHYSAPFTGDAKIICPKGIMFATSCTMSDDSFYMLPVGLPETMEEKISEIVKAESEESLYNRWSGVSFYITIDQLRTYPIKFMEGSLAKILKLLELTRNSENYHFKDDQLLVFDAILDKC